ncbi:MAG: Gfo/Idh/MocA family oxidoreductase [SAR202 cluster bacterium]|jgi:predicted dehydrogenase|nr:Gfo/Idh/MocA family oxidoreductase [SAR202 cluster bacterium]MDP6664337.1 Gfo/Idh/MocA family oxidoreductase [SAR202 cluster bacterium]|tara:strand:+ start:1285 stop:2421 length:1137 start_codon:yes stop_codon:yes gene_type:complete
MSLQSGSKPMGVGLIGCGVISGQYLTNLPRMPGVEVLACSDIDMAKAESRASEFGVPQAMAVDELLNDPDIELVLNLTIPKAHADVSLAIIGAGKHVYSEKPLTVDLEDATFILQAARQKGVAVGCAPDTFLGGGIQTCRKLIDDGAIGQPVAATAFMMNHGHESWHPDPAFYYQEGGGPMFDMGPYYLTALVNLMGPVKWVAGSAGAAFADRTIGSEPLRGQTINVDVPTHVAGVLDFGSGAIGTIITSFDVWASRLHRTIEIYGIDGTLAVPDPNIFGGRVQVRRGQEAEWSDVPLTHPEGGRGLGVAEMAAALRQGRKSRVDAQLANHVLDVMHSIHESSTRGRHIAISATAERPAAVEAGLPEGRFDSVPHPSS